MNRRQLAKNGFLALCGALMGKKIVEPPISLTCGTEGGIYLYREYAAGSTEPIPPGWDFLNDPGEDVYNGTC